MKERNEADRRAGSLDRRNWHIRSQGVLSEVCSSRRIYNRREHTAVNHTCYRLDGTIDGYSKVPPHQYEPDPDDTYLSDS